MDSTGKLDSQYTQAGFKDEAKFGLHPLAVTKILSHAAFVMYRRVAIYRDSKKAITDYDNGSRSFSSASSGIQANLTVWLQKQETKDVKLLVRPEARVENMKTRIDSLADQLSSLNLLFKKGQPVSAPTESAGRGYRQTCPKRTFEKRRSFFQNPVHGDNLCVENRNRDKRCGNYEKVGHEIETFWAKKQPIEAVVKASSGQVTLIGGQIESSSSESNIETSKDGDGSVKVQLERSKVC